MKILLVGGGITSAVTGACLRRILPDCHISLWDKAKGSGGRMTTSRCKVNPSCLADIGAQYITTTDDVIKANFDIYDELILQGVIEPLNSKIKGFKDNTNRGHYVVPNGMGFLVKHFIQKAKLNEIKFVHHVHSIDRDADKWRVQTKSGEMEYFNVVVLTMPIPQVFLLEGTIQDEMNLEIINQMKAVKYSSRFVLVLFFSQELKEDWGAEYFEYDPIFRYASIDNVKRNRPGVLSAVVFHTSVNFGLEHIEATIADIEIVLLSHAKSLFPNWPEPASVKCQKWRYSQVLNNFPESSGCLVISTKPPLIVGGDGFTGSSFDGCIKSSKSICDKLEQLLNMDSSFRI